MLLGMNAVFRMLLHVLKVAATLIWRVVGPVLATLLQIVAALLVLFEEWGWRPLSNALARLARFRPWARLELAIAGLPPYAALAAIALPSSLLFPLKFVAIWLVANGYLITAAALFVAAKVVSTALIARIFILVKPALMQIGWFAALYDRFVPWKEAIFARIRATWVWRYGRMVKTAVRVEAKQFMARWRPGAVAAARAAREWAASRWRILKPRILLLARRTWDRIGS
ncbi:MAG: hypothetical protein Q7T86_10180 [Hyphomicrobiaceae bacterium]|nr:hypothetical protein [Hyphomicrobiaceae bacterium]